MTGSSLTAGDIMALTKGNDGFLEGNGIIILILFFLILGFGGFGGNRNTDTVTTADLYSSLGSQNVMNDIRTGFANVATSMSALNTQVLDNKFSNQLGLQNLGTQINGLGSQMASCCCDLKTAIHSEGEATRDLIQQNYISGLTAEIQDLKSELSNANQTSSITNGILNTIGKWYANPAYYSSCTNNCGCNSSII